MPKYSLVLNAESAEELRRLSEALYIAENKTFKDWHSDNIMKHYTEMFGPYENLKKELETLQKDKESLLRQTDQLKRKIGEYKNELAALQA